MKKVSLCLHDVRVSENKETIRIITAVMNRFNAPLTVHMVFDSPLSEESELFSFLAENTKNGRIEIVFHGLTHSCAVKTGKLYSFYHKYQAEYLVDSQEHREKTAGVFSSVKKMFNSNPGICPPCWLSHKNNYRFFVSLKPEYIESMLSMNFLNHKFFSPVMSIGSPVKSEIRLLKQGLNFMYLLSLALPGAKTRMVVHVCDVDIEDSMLFFHKRFTGLIDRGFKSVLQRELPE